MSSVAEIEQAIAKLHPGEFVELERWFEARRNRKWDRQIEEDSQSGRLREACERLQAENQGQPSIPLEEFLDGEELSQPLQMIPSGFVRKGMALVFSTKGGKTLSQATVNRVLKTSRDKRQEQSLAGLRGSTVHKSQTKASKTSSP